MDKKTAALTLVERLSFVFGKKSFNVVSNTYYQKKLMEESIACYQIGISTELSRDYLSSYYKDNICQKAEPGSNYLFIDLSSGATDKLAVSSFAMIGKEEVSLLRSMLYKDVPRGMVLAMESLGIKNYLQLYRHYSDGSMEKLLREYVFYSKLKDSLAGFFYANDYRNKKFEEYFGEKTEKVTKMLKDMSLNNIFDEDYVSKRRVNDAVLGIEKSSVFEDTVLLVPEFVDFVFKLPQKDLNLEMNKKILALFQDRIDYPSILAQEYTSGSNFQEYFSCLSEDNKAETARHLSNVAKQRNLILDSFLWHEGFKEINLDYMSLYREDAKNFIRYYSSKSLEERKTIIKDLLGSDFVNEEVISWLNENEQVLVREVGLNG
ncbi:MAG: hypothetical protein Q8N77_03315 [Nanoarchaeota archaeon]|nr:hypothetical protein [Nanoarchaeota archaeon]